MALYFDTKLQPPLTAGNRVYIDIDWHKLYPLLAVALFDDKKGGLVCFHDAETQETMDIDVKPQPNVQVVCISWHPTQKVLAIGYESGEVVVWNLEENESFEGTKGHNAAVVLIQWSACGNVLITADNMGSLVNWKSDYQGHLQLKAHHDFKDPVCQVVFRTHTKGNNLNELATERTLGKMTTWRPKTGVKRSPRTDSEEELEPRGNSNERCFFVGLLSGAIYYVRDGGSSEEVLTSGSAVKSLLFHEAGDILIVMTEAYILGQFHVDPNGGLNEVNKMKLSGQGDVRVSWVGSGTLAVISEELSVRLWDVTSGDNMVLEPKGNDYAQDEVFCSIDFNVKSGVLCCCTNKGKLVMWRETAQAGDTELGDDGKWEWYNSSQVSPSIKAVKWCQNQQGLLALNGMRDVFILREQELVSYHGEKISAIQANPTDVIVKMTDPPSRIELHCDFHVKGIITTATHICVWSGKKVATYEVGPSVNTDYKLVGTFSSKCITICIHDLSLFLLDISEVQVVTFQGTVKQTLNFLPTEGDPITIYIGGEYLTVGTLSGYIKVWHVARREPKLHHPAFKITDAVDNFGEIIHAKNNKIGTKVAFTVAQVSLLPDSRFCVWDLTTGEVSFLEFPGRFVSSFYWDWQDSMFMALETRVVPMELLHCNTSNAFLSPDPNRVSTPVRLSREEPIPEIENTSSVSIEVERETSADMIISLFVCSDRGLLTHDMSKKEFQFDSLIGLDVPYLYFTRQENIFKPHKRDKRSKSSETSETSVSFDGCLKTTIEKKLVKDFDGIDENEPASRAALVSYVYNNLIGDVDEALKAMKAIKNVKIWDNMARNCVKTKRLDVAFICLARMRNARAARAVREAELEPEVEAQVAMLAIQLNMPDEAEALYLQCKRYDLLLHLYKISRQWDKGIKLCEKHCRIHLRTTYYAYAKYLETEKRIKEAIKMYELSETHRYEVPRMLVEDPNQLEAYINSKKDTDLYQWWAQYQESGGEIEAALKYYELAKDWLSLVRLLCFCGDMEKAAAVTEKVNDKASCYHLAKTLEDRGENHRAIHFLTKAGAYGNAIRICKENHLLDQLWSLALMAQPSDQLDAARFFETKSDRPDYDKAIQLYHRAGYSSKALDLAFSTQQYNALQLVAKDLITQQGTQTDPVLLQKCAEFFVMNGQVEKALDMLAAAHRYVEAMDLCVEHNLPITDDIAERLTAPKGVGLDEPTRIKLLEKIGECLLLQGNYHLAAKKYTQAGNKIQAMKALLKSGDTEKIVFYANVCRNRDIYMMAANYLQTTNWRASEEIQSLIVQFYTKAKAEESLAAFHASMAQMDDVGKQEKRRFFGSQLQNEEEEAEEEDDDEDSEELVEEEVIDDAEEIDDDDDDDEDDIEHGQGDHYVQDVNENRATPTNYFANALQYSQSASYRLPRK